MPDLEKMSNQKWWETFSPVSAEFKQAETIFHSKEFSFGKKIVVVALSVLGGLLFVIGAFPVFRWTVTWLKSETKTTDEKIQRASQRAQVITKASQSAILQNKQNGFAEKERVSIKNVIVPSLNISEIAFGKIQWEKYFGNIGEEPPLPANINDILVADCPIFLGKKIWETHLLMLIPEKVNGEPLTIESLGELVKKPKNGNGGHSSQYFKSPHSAPISFLLTEEDLKKSVPSHWVLITNDVIGGTEIDYGNRKNDNISRGKNYDQQVQMIHKIANHSGIPYEVPSMRDIVTCFFMHYVRSGEHVFKNPDFCTLTYCREKRGEDLMVVVVGCFGGINGGVSIDCNPSLGSESRGLIAYWKL